MLTCSQVVILSQKLSDFFFAYPSGCLALLRLILWSASASQFQSPEVSFNSILCDLYLDTVTTILHLVFL